ncbi:polysaccharide pyruvyl transferase family protein [Halalkalicoccus sp. NIPERK01]|uniref:polysaccharide pyruvyl transferase family protein n=1 Tax=Halalkalicoccus sp. NIPERK01 TaxID=3053469 RepID=UPI00256F3DED|nr:polysaccharide pyruvyl transferase family protein [Halalkalicoccus sp. NIPERK01]MDL5363431.1 polysaccharide pyruvyl transferase family protein [Halalkalicoccus sp. NIPERK01]
MSKTILLDGYYGARNIGDELILTSLIQLIQQYSDRTDTDYRIIAGSHNPNHTVTHHDVDAAVPRFTPSIDDHRAWLRAAREADEFWIGGGGLFGPRKMLKYAASASVARSFGTRVATVGIGVRPFHDGPEHSRRVARELLRHTDTITVRDRDSATSLSDIGVDQPIHTLADPVFGYDIVADRYASIPASVDRQLDDETLVVSVREPEVRNLDKTALAETLDRTLESTGCSILFVPFQTNRTPSDVTVAVGIANRMKSNQISVVEEEIGFREMVQVLEAAPLVIGMRLHSIITAAVVDTPVLGLAYHPKCESILRQLGQDPIIWCDAIDTDRLSTAIIGAWEEGTPYVSEAKATLRQDAQSLIETVEKGQSACSPVRIPLLTAEVVRAGTEKLLS